MRCLPMIFIALLTVCLTAPPASAGFLSSLRERLTRIVIRKAEPNEPVREEATGRKKLPGRNTLNVRIEPGIDDPSILQWAR